MSIRNIGQSGNRQPVCQDSRKGGRFRMKFHWIFV